jgi:two-component sensor histidine kinase
MHRSKNLLTVIQSIASVTARSNSSVNDFVNSFSKRVEALSRSQDLLVHGSTRTVKISELVEDQLSIAAGVDQRTRINGPLINLNPDAAQAIGMALHELATNSIKHGALSCDAGHVHIFWCAANDDLVFTWQESGGPEVPLPKRRGFGRTILEQVTPSKLAGRAELNFKPEGVS